MGYNIVKKQYYERMLKLQILKQDYHFIIKVIITETRLKQTIYYTGLYKLMDNASTSFPKTEGRPAYQLKSSELRLLLTEAGLCLQVERQSRGGSSHNSIVLRSP